MASSTLPSYPIQHDQQQHLSDYFTYASASAMNIPGASRYTSQQDDKSMTRECLLFPTYAFRNPKDPSEWVIRTRGWALSHNRSGAKQKFVTSISKGVVGQNSGDHAMFEERFKYFLAKNKRNKQFIIQAAGTHALPSDSWHSSPLSSFSSSPSSSSADLFDNNSSNTLRHFTDQSQQRRDSDGSTDSGFQSSGVTDKDDYSYHHFASDQGNDDFSNSNTAALFAMERPANPLSSILNGRRMQSTTSIPSSLSSNNSNDSKQYHGDNDDYDDDYDNEQYDGAEKNVYNTIDDELPSNDHYLTINTTNSDASTTTMSSLFTYPSFASSVTSPTSSSSASASDSVTLKANNDHIDKVDGRAIFKSESSGFFSGPTHLSHRQVLQWAKEKDYCDARLLQIKSTPYINNKDHHHKGMDPACAGTAPFPTSTGMVNLIEPTGISIISDIDDTIKETQILHGARTVLANTFFKESKDISGMAETYMKWYTQGASFHYVSNSPFQLLPFLHDFLNNTQFPPGSMHLRLDGSILARLIEIPGRAKRDSILGIMHDFPLRQFVLVGDSGEIDLEIYTKIAVENPGRILKIFIHDVTTPYAMQKKRTKKSASSTTSTTNDPADTISNSNGLPSLLRNNSMSLSSLFQTTSSSTLNSKRYSFDIHSQQQQQQRRPVSLQSTSSSPSLLEAAEEINKNKSNSLLELASSMASSSVLGLGRGRTKTLAEYVNEPSFSSTTSPVSSSATSTSNSSFSLPPSQQCIQLYDRVQKAQEQLPNIDIVLFQNADELRDDTTIQKALWQQWDDQCLDTATAPII
ncbi:hypothetical protein BCR42DRAFT_452193 [Absidia repens]|uniref:Phosphatidate phosphatase APP1 catalytic domain-containing protein n=1 Tax=Absidia repens TaxID=90262 RepID=A0A1X2IF53_9FUNG|nr:hypothetical protein BCR42DRAFT_452193 [Absidia repens]